MKTTYINNKHSRYWLGQRNWALNILNNPNVQYPNGKYSHDAAGQILEQAEDELLNDLALEVTN